MAEDKKSFLLYVDLIHTVRKMPKDKIADLFVTILEYVNDENPVVEDLVVDLVFEPIKRQLKRDLEKWDKKIDKYANAGREGGKKSGEVRRKKTDEAMLQDASENEAKRSDASENERIEAVNVTVNDIVNVTDNVNVINEMPLGHEMQMAFLKTNPTYPLKPNKDFPAIIELAVFIHQQSGGTKNQIFEIDVGERKTILSEWQKWCSWYQTKGNNKSLDFLVKFKIQDIYLEIKNGKKYNGEHHSQPGAGFRSVGKTMEFDRP